MLFIMAGIVKGILNISGLNIGRIEKIKNFVINIYLEGITKTLWQ